MINYTDKYLNKREETIKKIYTPQRFLKDVEIKNLQDLFSKFFTQKRITYNLEGHKVVGGGRSRSLIACYQMCMHYFPELSYREMYRILQNFSSTNQYTNFYTCPTVGRAVYQGGIKFENEEVETYGW